MEDFERCYRAVQSRDPRFDGWFFTAVTSTCIYCRPSCPARTPSRANVRFYPSAAAAQRAGFRACMRCRPDAAPGSPEWDTRADVVGRAMRLIADGVVDRDGVAGLAERLGYGVRHLHRLLCTEVGAGPLALARAQRVQTARILIETTEVPMADVAFAAGFSSIRQFNDTVREVLGRTPIEMRRRTAGSARMPNGAGQRGASTAGQRIALRLPYRRPLAAGELFDFLRHRALAGVECAAPSGGYARTLRLPRGPGWVSLEPRDDHVGAVVWLADLRDLTAAVGRCRRLLDLDADPEAVDALLGADPHLAPGFVHGLRVPGGDGFEMAVRAVAGQQVSTSGARSVVGRLVEACGTPFLAPNTPVGLTHTFPEPEAVLEAPDAAFAMPVRRRATLRALAASVADGSLAIDPGADPGDVRALLLALPGIGPWTASYVGMRGLGDPDAFMPTDLGVRRGLERVGLSGDPGAAMAASERWRPWRSYALMQLWARLELPTSRIETQPPTPHPPVITGVRAPRPEEAA